jgi:hypothetical protein
MMRILKLFNASLFKLLRTSGSEFITPKLHNYEPNFLPQRGARWTQLKKTRNKNMSPAVRDTKHKNGVVNLTGPMLSKGWKGWWLAAQGRSQKKEF